MRAVVTVSDIVHLVDEFDRNLRDYVKAGRRIVSCSSCDARDQDDHFDGCELMDSLETEVMILSSPSPDPGSLGIQRDIPTAVLRLCMPWWRRLMFWRQR